MKAGIEILKPKKLIGIHMQMSVSDNRTPELWKQFMPRRGEVMNRVTADYISMQKYGKDWNFSPDSIFEKWAAVEVSAFAEVPTGMETYILTGGKYAVFTHHGPASLGAQTMQYIFGQWLPNSGYQLDDREHFEILPAGYSPVDPQAHEEIWIPVKDKP